MAIKVSLLRQAGRKHFEAQWREGGKKKRRSTGTAKRREAERFANRLEKELNDGTFWDRDAISWNNFCDRYESEALAGLAKGTLIKRLSLLDLIEDAIQPNYLKDVDAGSIARWVRLMRDRQVSEATIAGYLQHLRSILNWAHKHELIPKKIPISIPKAADKMRGRPITAEEFERMIAVVFEVVEDRKREEGEPDTDRVHTWKFLLTGLWWSGLRLSEALELSWDDQSRLCVEPDWSLRIQGVAQKNRKSTVIALAPEFVDQLQTVPDEQRAGFVFSPLPLRARTDRPNQDAVGRTLAKISKRANVVTGERTKHSKKGKPPERVPQYATAHDFRRAFGTRWSTCVPAQILQILMRHNDIATTMKFYAEQNAVSMAKFLREAMKRPAEDAKLRMSSGT